MTTDDPWADLDDDEMTARIYTRLNRFLALCVFSAVACIVGFSFLERPWWPLGLAFGFGYGGVILVNSLFAHVACKHGLRQIGVEKAKHTVWRVVAGAAVVIAVAVAGSYAFDALEDRKGVVVGVMCAFDVLAVSGIRIWWCHFARGGGAAAAAAAAATFELKSSPEISPV